MNNDERGYEMAIENIERQLTERFFQHMELLQAIKALGITEEVRAKVDELAKENFVPQIEHGLHLFDIDEMVKERYLSIEADITKCLSSGGTI